MKRVTQIPPVARQLPQRSKWWVVSTYVATSLVVTIVVLFLGSCVSSFILQSLPDIGDIAGFLLLCAWFSVAGFTAASHSGQYLRMTVQCPLPTVLIRQCTIWFAAVLLTGLVSVAVLPGLLAITVRQSSWLFEVAIPLAGFPGIAIFWWQTRSQFRKWEQEQQPPKSYGFPVTLLVQSPPIPPATSPPADKDPPPSMP